MEEFYINFIAMVILGICFSLITNLSRFSKSSKIISLMLSMLMAFIIKIEAMSIFEMLWGFCFTEIIFDLFKKDDALSMENEK